MSFSFVLNIVEELMKKVGITFLFILICYISFAGEPIVLNNADKVSILFRVTPSNYFLEDPVSVYQFGGEARYKKYGISLEYGLQSRKVNMPDVNRYYNRYYSVRSEWRSFKDFGKKEGQIHKKKYIGLEYLYREQLSSYHYHGFGNYAYHDLTISYKTNGIRLKQGNIFVYKKFEFEIFTGVGVNNVKTRIISKRGSDEVDNSRSLHIFYQNLGFKNEERLRLSISAGFRLAYNIYSFIPKKESFLNHF